MEKSLGGLQLTIQCMEMNAGKSNDSLPAVSRKGLAGRPIVKMNNPMQEASKKENPRKVSIPLVSRVLLLISLLGPQGIVRGILLISWMQPLVFVLMADGC